MPDIGPMIIFWRAGLFSEEIIILADLFLTTSTLMTKESINAGLTSEQLQQESVISC